MQNYDVEHFHQWIDESTLRKQTVDELSSIVNDFFCQDYGGISSKERDILLLDFQIRCLKAQYDPTDKYKVQGYFDNLQRNFRTLLDKSVDSTGKLEKILDKLPDNSFILQANVTSISNYHVIKYVDAKHFSTFYKFFCHCDILSAGRWVAGWVVM